VSLCLAAPLLAITLSAPAFTLAWTHSVEKTEWRERWRVQGDALVLDEARVRGSGAGMEPPEGSVLQDGWWVYHADLRVPVLRLASSGATGSGWRLCTEAEGCRELETLLSMAGQLPAWMEVRPGVCGAGT
jgi:hypothetical protein